MGGDAGRPAGHGLVERKRGSRRSLWAQRRGEAAGSSLRSGGAEELGAVSTRAKVGGGEVASSSSLITLAFTVVAEEENSESSRDGVHRSTALRGGVESNFKHSEKPSS